MNEKNTPVLEKPIKEWYSKDKKIKLYTYGGDGYFITSLDNNIPFDEIAPSDLYICLEMLNYIDQYGLKDFLEKSEYRHYFFDKEWKHNKEIEQEIICFFEPYKKMIRFNKYQDMSVFTQTPYIRYRYNYKLYYFLAEDLGIEPYQMYNLRDDIKQYLKYLGCIDIYYFNWQNAQKIF